MSTTQQPGSDTAPVEIDATAFERRWKILAVLCTSLMVVIVGNTALNVALPTLARELNASISAAAVDGRRLRPRVRRHAADRGHHRRPLRAQGHAAGRPRRCSCPARCSPAFSHSAAAIIVGRAVMGLGAAFVMPATLSILTNVFPPHERGKAIAIWAGISGGGAAVGPVASGFLLEHFSWGSVFLVNVPIIAVALVAGYILLPKSRDPHPEGLDPIGALLSIAGLGSLVYAIIEAPDRGWASGRACCGSALRS